jgi:hypothetical protein
MNRIITFAFLGLLLLFAYWLGYRNGVSHAQRTGRVIIARDANDMPPVRGEHVASYDPYFIRQNPIPEKVK